MTGILADLTSFFDVKTLVGAPATLALGYAIKWGKDAYIAYRKQRWAEQFQGDQFREEVEERDDKRADESYQFIIGQLRGQVEAWSSEVVNLRKALDESREAAHREREQCIRDTAELRQELALLKQQVSDHTKGPQWYNAGQHSVEMHFGDNVLTVPPGHAVVPTSDGPMVVTPQKFEEFKGD